MKSIPQITKILILLFFSTATSLAQDLGNLTVAAMYSLINTPNDFTGLNDPIELTNTPYSGPDGVYSNGIAVGNDPDGCLIRTPLLEALYDSVFAIQLQFKLTDLNDGDRHAVLVCGESYRYIGLILWEDGTFRILYNNQYYIDLPGITPAADQWYDLTLICNTSTHQNQFYLGTDMIADFNQELIRVPDDGRILNRHAGAIWTFKGYWRNLVVYRSGNTTSVHGPVAKSEEVKIYPNPTRTSIHIEESERNATEWSITDVKGTMISSGDLEEVYGELDISFLSPGLYILRLFDSTGVLITNVRFMKSD